MRARNDGQHVAAAWIATFVFLAAWATHAEAASYYVDAVDGNDANNGQLPTQAWKTLAKLNTYLASRAVPPAAIQPGDEVYLKRGSVWDDTLLIRRSGQSGSIISFLPYGENGNAPTIRGSKPLSDWAQDGERWKVAVPEGVSQLTFTKNGTTTVLPFARYPNVDPLRSPHVDMLHAQSPVTCLAAGAISTEQSAADFNPRSCGLIHMADATLAKQDLSGAEVIVRDGNYRFDRRRVASYDVGAAKLIWAAGTITSSTPIAQKPVTYPVAGGYGFYMAGKAWMIDQPGEWAVEMTAAPLNRTLILSAPDGLPPSDGAVRYTPSTNNATPKGIDAESQGFISIQGLQIVDATVGMELTNTSNVYISDVHVLRSSLIGVRADSANGLTVSNSHIEQTGFRGITGDYTVGVTISGNTIATVGTHLPPNGDSLWYGINTFGIQLGWPQRATVSGNTITDNAYIGVFIMPATEDGDPSVVNNNVVRRSCLYLDDCAALYTYTANRLPLDTRVVFSGNYVDGASGSCIGRPLDSTGQCTPSSAQGIYLDFFAKGVVVDGNLVVDTDHALQVHMSQENTVTNNIFVASRMAEIWFQEDTVGAGSCDDPINCIVANSITGNFHVGLPGVPNYLLDSNVGNTTDFASFNDNRYANAFTGFSVSDRWLALGQPLQTSYGWPQWQANGNDSHSSMSSQRLASLSAYAGYKGADLLPNGDFTSSTTGWDYWAAAGSPSLTVVSGGNGVNGSYARFQASSDISSDSILNTSGGFAVRAGKQYMLRFAVRSEGANVTAYAALRNNANYGNLSQMAWFTATGNWQYLYLPLNVSTTADGSAAAPALSRLDFQVPAGTVLDLDEIQINEAALPVNLVVNGEFQRSVANWDYYPHTAGYSLTHDSGGFAKAQGPAGDATDVTFFTSTTSGFNIRAGKTYLVRFAMRSQGGATTGYAVIRNNATYDNMSTRFTFTVDGSWKYYYAPLSVSATGAARLDFQMQPGATIELDDVLLTELNATPVEARSLIHVFPGGPSGAGTYNCPDADTPQAARCTTYIDLRTGLPVAWPLAVPKAALTDSVVALAVDSRFQDSDGDGVADVNDLCPTTPANTKVDERGCSFAQRRVP